MSRNQQDDIQVDTTRSHSNTRASQQINTSAGNILHSPLDRVYLSPDMMLPVGGVLRFDSPLGYRIANPA